MDKLKAIKLLRGYCIADKPVQITLDLCSAKNIVDYLFEHQEAWDTQHQIDEIRKLAEGNITGCGTCHTILNLLNGKEK